MRRAFLAAAIAATYLAIATPARAQTVLQWNLHNDCESDATCRQSEIAFVANLDAHLTIVTVQEIYDSDVAEWTSTLTSLTGRDWHAVFQSHRRDDGNNCGTDFHEGVAIFTTWPILESEGKIFPFADQYVCGRAAVRAKLNVDGQTLQVFTAHMTTADAGGNTAAVGGWAAAFSRPQLVSCDCNGSDGEASPIMKSAFLDGWLVAGSGAGTTFPQDGRRIDYWFSDAFDELWPVSADIPSSTLSDHSPLRVTYAQNLLSKGGFENDSPPTLAAPGWVSDSDRQTAAKLETNQWHSGAQNGACWSTNGTDCGMFQDVPAAVSGTYTYTVYAAADESDGLVGVNVNGQSIDSKPVQPLGFGNYVKYEVTFAATQNDIIRVWMYSPAIPSSPGHYVVIDDTALTVSPQ